MRVRGVCLHIDKNENPQLVTSEDPNDETFEIKTEKASIVILTKYSDRAEDEPARIERWLNTCDYLEVTDDGDLRFHSSKPLEGYTNEFLTKNHGFFAEVFSDDFFDWIINDPEQG